MVKYLSIITFILYGSATAQIDPAIKIYLEDGETGKTIADATVKLEGFEIPAIKGNYDKAGKFYFFTDIPDGYNTVMAYHEQYNEKGFQDISGLPPLVNLRLYDPLNISYDFFEKPDSILNYRAMKYIRVPNYRELYVEDPYKIGMKITGDCESLLKNIRELCPEIEAVNPYYKDNKEFDPDYDQFSCSKLYIRDYNAPLERGYSRKDSFGYNDGPTDDPVLFFRKKDGSKFKRFNDPLITRLNSNKFRPCTVIYHKATYVGRKKYKKRYTKKLDDLNSNTGQNRSRIIFYKRTALQMFNNPKFIEYYANYNRTSEYTVDRVTPVFSLIEPYDCDRFEIGYWEYTDAALLNSSSLGLGFFDQLEYFCNINGIKVDSAISDIKAHCEY